jgi:hypothetical protein|tara:strand:+ start:180 stop:329 length:150 start_codon:yes stop_codon:yes gene_type:complete
MYPNQLESLIDSYSQNNDPKKHITVGFNGYPASESVVENSLQTSISMGN